MKKNKNKQIKVFTLKETIIISILSCFITFLTVGIILYNNYEKISGISYNQLSNDEDLQEFLEVYASVTDDYYEDVDKKEVLSAALDAMLEYLGDSYTTYLNSDENTIIEEQLNGEYIGIGITINSDNVINSVFSNSPAMEAGIQTDDKIIKIDDQDFSNSSSEDIATYIKSKKNETITLTVLRDETQLEFSLTPTSLATPVVSYTTIEQNSKNIGYMYITTFSSTLNEQVVNALTELENDNIESLIIDLRGNSGGYLSAANSVSSLFLEKGKIIYTLENKNTSVTYKDETSESRQYPIVVLINNNTASAAEILASALQESYGATLVGQTSYGKGKVQQLMNLSNGTAVKYTTAKWYTPNHTCIDQVGITPDYEVENEYNEQDKSYIDRQLEKAIEILANE